MTSALLGLALTLAAPAPKEAPKPAVTENPLLGEWIVESHLASGKPLDRAGKPDRVTVTKDRWKRERELSAESNLSLHPTKDPPHIDIWVASQAEESRVRAIYRLDGDTLTICYSLRAERPTKLESPAGSGMFLMTLKRAGAGK